MTKTVLLFTLLVFVCYGASVEGNRVLVILNDVSSQQQYSKFFNSLTEREYKLSFNAADNSSLTLSEYGEYLYDHVIIFSPSADEFGGLVTTSALVEFIDRGHNVIIGADSTVSDAVRDLATECGVEFDDEGYQVFDHFHTSKVSDENVIDVDPIPETTLLNDIVTGSSKTRKPVLFKGIGQTIKENNGLNFGILKGYATTYSAKPNAEIKKVHAGPQVVLVSALQARNNARVLVSGSLQMFSDKFFTQSSDNEYLVNELSKWVFKEKGVLRSSNATHHIEGELIAPQFYTIKDRITYSVKIEEWNGKQWVPYVANDVQLEFTMLDPYIRTFLTPSKTGEYNVTFVAPDVYGVFSFKVNYHKLGYSTLNLKNIHSVRPFRHDQYERFIQTANPYYLSSISMLVGVFILTVFLLFTK